jgi:uncharacterized protein (TIGR02118 family)
MAQTLVSRRHAILASLALGAGPPAAKAQPLAQLPAKQGSREMNSSNGVPARARFTILWSKPKDVDAFERHYREVHVPLAKKMPGLRRYTISRNTSPVRGGEPYFLIAELDWDDMAALQLAFASPEGRATGADMAIQTDLSTGVHSMIYELEDV